MNMALISYECIGDKAVGWIGASAHNAVAMLTAGGHSVHLFSSGENDMRDALMARLTITQLAGIRAVIVNVRIRDAIGAPFGMASLGGFAPESMVALTAGENQFVMSVIVPPLANGTYLVDLDLEEPYGHFYDRVNDQLSFEVLRKPSSSHGRVLQTGWGVGPAELEARNTISADARS